MPSRVTVRTIICESRNWSAMRRRDHAAAGGAAHVHHQSVDLSERRHALAELLRGLAAHLVDLRVADAPGALEVLGLDARDHHLAAHDLDVEALLHVASALQAE
jgi:hypothetical protein